MTISVVVFPTDAPANQLVQKLRVAATPLVKCELVQPDNQFSTSLSEKELSGEPDNNLRILTPVEINSISILNPKISRKSRQKNMALWLMPFGFLAGLTFTQMTGLKTFSGIGLGSLGEPLIGSLLGMGSGWIGSYVASASVNPTPSDEIKRLRKHHEKGDWLLVLETPFEVELPWKLLQEFNPIEILRVRDL